MNIVVLTKVVPDTSAQVAANAAGNDISPDGIEFVINPYDEYAIEEALKIQADKGGEVTLLSVGPDSSQKTLRKGLAMGAHKAVLIDDEAVAGSDTVGVAKALAKAIEEIGADLVLAGREAVDHGGGCMGGAVAEVLGWPQANDIVKCEVTGDKTVTVNAEREGGHAVLEIQLPAVLTAQKGLNEPRFASLKGIMKAKKKPLDKKTAADLGLDAGALAPKVSVTALAAPPVAEKSLRMFEGDDAASKAKAAVAALTGELKIV